MTGSIKRQKHTNVALFVPHKGCPHQCSFCDQRAISGALSPLTPADVTAACERAIATMKTDPSSSEIAFFGGSFTAIAEDTQIALLSAAYPFVKDGHFRGIRVSTRPDAINKEILERLCRFGVTAVELGAQSMKDEVLTVNERGHTAEDVKTASALIRGYGLSLGLQMMTGLPGSSREDDRKTAETLCTLQPDTMRIYPTVVVENTRLSEWWRQGIYTPLSLEEAVEQGADLLALVEGEWGIPVIRMGLHAGGDVESHYLAGPYHPAFRELCDSRLYARKMLSLLHNHLPNGGAATLFVAPSALSKAIGQKQSNLIWLKQQGYEVTIKSDPQITETDVNL